MPHSIVMPQLRLVPHQTSRYERHTGTCSDHVPSTRHCGPCASSFTTYPRAHVTFKWSPGSYENLTGAILPFSGSPGYGHRALPVAGKLKCRSHANKLNFDSLKNIFERHTHTYSSVFGNVTFSYVIKGKI
jgi:hypothetical protein